jgi:hypothetical protein
MEIVQVLMHVSLRRKINLFFSWAGGLWIGRKVKVIEQVLEPTYKESRDQDVGLRLRGPLPKLDRRQKDQHAVASDSSLWLPGLTHIR